MALWNYPLSLCFGPLESALAAGNTAIIKPSEMTPAVSALMGRIVASVFRANEVALFEDNLPFGGVNNSGVGSAHGEYGFEAFSHERAVLRASPLMLINCSSRPTTFGAPA